MGDRWRLFLVRNGLFLVLAAALVLGLGAAVWYDRLGLAVAVALAFFGSLTAFFASRFALALESDPDRPGFESHWGGLGGGLGGWRLSVSLVYLVAAIAFGSLLALTAGLALGERTVETEEASKPAATADPNAPAEDAESAGADATDAAGAEEGAPEAADPNEPAPPPAAGGGAG